MITFIKRYWLNILLLAILNILIWLIIPYQERKYLQPDIDSIKEKSNLILILTEVILFGSTLIFFTVKNFKSPKKILFSIFNIAMLSLAVFLFFTSIFLAGTLFLNSLSKNQIVDKKYSIIYIDSNKTDLLLWDITENLSVQNHGVISTKHLKNINLNDTIILTFKKGLLGVNFDPKAKTK
ncbi:MAG: hypothetical protein C0459_08465 [Chitinophaga sp.]|jgi:hypothetical protein|nr:hypothetical protein [Chitinophaga sp.]